MKVIDNRPEKRGFSNGLRPTRALAARPNRDLDVRGGTITLPCSGDNRGSLDSLGKKVLVEL
jgi:hypothetical protein